MGRGHSGSTILDILLGGGAAVESVGELVSASSGMRAARAAPAARRRASARTGPRSAAASRPRASWAGLARASRRQTDVRRWLRRGSPPGRSRACRLAAMTRSLASAIAATSASQRAGLNKEVARGLFLLRYLPEARVVHLVRDPRGIQRSHHWRLRDQRGFLFMRRRFAGRGTAPLLLLLAAASWTVGNALGELTRRAAPDRVLRLRYEDLCRDPAGAVRAIGAGFGLPVEDVVARLESGEPSRSGRLSAATTSGTPARCTSTPGPRARPPLPRWAERATLLLCWPLMRHYGYAA